MKLFAVAILAAGASLALARPARANDSTAEVAGGGLVFTHNPDVEMRSEDLYISAKQVRVRYEFVNTSSHDVRVHVAFPLPDIDGSVVTAPGTIADVDNENYVGCLTYVDGKPQTAEIEKRAVFKGRDVTEELNELNIPLEPLDVAIPVQFSKIPKEKQAQLRREGLIAESECGEVCGQWTFKTTYYWEQVFPAGKTVVIEHTYIPVVGQSSGTSLGSRYADSNDSRYYRDKYCIDEAYMGAVRKMAARDKPEIATEQRIDYILKTGANWKAPIGRFRLVVDKGRPENLVSFCGENIRKISPTRFEVVRTNFLPDRDLSILILRPVR